MRFSAVHKVVSYLMCASAFLALALSRELSPQLVAATAAFGFVSIFVEPSRFSAAGIKRWTLLWNVATLCVFALAAMQALRGELLPAGVRLICFLLVNKLFNRRASRDYQQAYVLSFLMLVAGAALSADLSYAACFLFYVVFTTWTLTLFHLRREMEDNYLLKHSDDAQSERVEVERILNSRRIIGGDFLVGTALVSLAIFLCSGLAFFLIPRFGFGFFASHGRKQQSTVGFADRVDLNEYGLIKDNPQIVLRVELPNGLPVEPLRFRGVAFDHYQGGHWTRSSKIPEMPFLRRGRIGFLAPGTQKLDGPTRERLLDGAVVQRIYLDPLDTSVMFAASMPIAFELPPADLGSTIEMVQRHPGELYAVDEHLDLRGRVVTTERKSGMRYTVYSHVGRNDLGRLLDEAAYTSADPPAELAAYLTLPPLPKRIKDLAQALIAGRRTRFQQALAVEQYLQTRLRYTLDLKRDERYEPIEDFLFVQKAGHCEYFASSMAVLLRTVGIPTRVVNGFLGGEWNSYGHYLAVRQGDAHSWVEVWLGDAGWVTFDPTPIGNATMKSNGLLDGMRQVVDTLELAWFKYVIEYDLGKQVEIAQGARRAMSTGWSPTNLRSTLTRGAPVLIGLGLLVGIVILLRRNRRRSVHDRRMSDLLLGRALDALARRGIARQLGETSRELSRRAYAAGDPGADAFSRLVERHYAARYGQEPVPKSELESLTIAVIRPPTPKQTGASAS